MKTRFLISALVALLKAPLPAVMQKEDIIEVPAIGEDLCVSNLF